jgi:hypothetical protein
MRPSSLTPLLALLIAGGCGPAPEETGRASTVPTRDLTLERAPAPAVAVASPLEVSRRPEQPKAHRPRRASPPAKGPAPASRPAPPDAAPVAVPAPVPAVAATPAPAKPALAEASADPRVLEPGQTVTVIPASNGPSVGSDPAAAPPSRAGRAIMIGRGQGGTCQPHGALRGVAAPLPL